MFFVLYDRNQSGDHSMTKEVPTVPYPIVCEACLLQILTILRPSSALRLPSAHSFVEFPQMHIPLSANRRQLVS